ncbi:hypothetical protein [Bacillus sp. Marseille-Q1617]|uniref:hypothetical protein n=1 Tax=Bacillus sp. Marseille-Q1617 TaxID=2736887 RepID=UPI00158957D3|nr:hypothetical protein [Bacillus sp. Marseille-Q1617]
MLVYDDVKKLFPKTRGVGLQGIGFHKVSSLPDVRLERGLYIPLESHEKLFESINNGAVASLWQGSEKVPLFVPNHFPLFIVEDVHSAYRELIQYYKQKNNQEKWEIMTKFICGNESDLFETVDAEFFEVLNLKKKGGE